MSNKKNKKAQFGHGFSIILWIIFLAIVIVGLYFWLSSITGTN